MGENLRALALVVRGWCEVLKGGVQGVCVCFFFQAEDGIRGAQQSRGLGDGYKRQVRSTEGSPVSRRAVPKANIPQCAARRAFQLSLIHI